MGQPVPWWITHWPGASSPVLQGITARPIADQDLAFLQTLYASTRADEMAATGWPAAQCHEFLAQQFLLQHRYYREHYTDASFLLLTRGEAPIGRLYWREEGEQASLVDVSLVPAERGRGLGTALMHALIARAARRGQAIVLHVEPDNPARRLYLRCGFEVIAGNGVYDKMRRPARAGQPEEALAT